MESPGIYLCFKLTNMHFMYRTPRVNKCTKYSCYIATCDEHFAIYCMYCHTVYTE